MRHGQGEWVEVRNGGASSAASRHCYVRAQVGRHVSLHMHKSGQNICTRFTEAVILPWQRHGLGRADIPELRARLDVALSTTPADSALTLQARAYVAMIIGATDRR